MNPLKEPEFRERAMIFFTRIRSKPGFYQALKAALSLHKKDPRIYGNSHAI